MATIPTTPGRSGMPGTPNLRLGTGMVSPDDLGANQWGEITRLGRTIGMAGNELQQWSMRKYDEEAQAESLQWQNSNMRLLGEESNRIKTLVGEEAANGPKAYEDYARGLDEDAMKNLKTPLAKRLYQQRMQQFNNQQGLSIDAHTLQEHERTMQVSLAASVQQEIDNAASNAGNGIAFVDAIQRIKGYNAQRFHGMPAEYIEQQNRNNSMLAIQSASARLANDAGTQAALDFLNSGVDAEVGGGALKVKFDELRKQYGNVMIADAKKQAENEMRQIGIRLGDQFDNEYEIIDALRGIEDRDLAGIAREEAETVRKARLAMGKEKPMTAEEKAQENRMARKQASTILAGADTSSPDDDITDEDTLDVALDEAMTDDTEVRREKVRKYAVSQMKAKKVAQAQERRSLDQEAMRVMASAGWSPSAIDAGWPEDLQDKMLERSDRRLNAMAMQEERAAKAARKARGLEYLEMPLEELNEKILSGEWVNIVDDVGAGTEEFTKLERRIKGEGAAGLTMLQYAKNEFTRIIGDTGKKKKAYAEFIQKVDDARTAEAAKLKLDNKDMIPQDRQKQIINEFLLEGDFRWWESSGYFSPNKYRFQVSDEDLPDWKPFDAPAASAGELPAFAEPYFSPRDTRRELLPTGAVLIETQDGSATVINPDGSIEGNR